MSAAVLSRIQFALTVSFHFLFPPLTVGLGLADLEPAGSEHHTVLTAGT
jgi:Cytochrome bd terminal oxidase subunit I